MSGRMAVIRRPPSPMHWLAAVAALLVLVAAMLVAGAAEFEAPPAADRHEASPALEASLVVRPPLGDGAGAADAAPALVREAAAPGEVGAGDVAPRELLVHVQRAFGDRTPPYVGPLVVRAAGRVVLTTVRKDQTPVAIEVPVGCEQVEFEAPDHSTALVAVPAPSARARPLRAVLQPAARLRIVASHREPLVAGSWELAVSTAHLDHATLIAPAGDVPFVRGAAWRWRATLSLPGQRVVLHGEEPALATGEVRDLRIDFGAVAMQRYRVVGPSTELLPHLVLQQHWGEGDGSDGVEVPLDATGAVWLVPIPGSRFHIGDVAMRPTKVGAETELAPEQALFGIGLVDDSGAWLCSHAYDGAGKRLSYRRCVHGLARGVAKLGLRLGSESRTAQPVPGSVLVPGGDLVRVLQVAPADTVLGKLLLRIEGEPPSDLLRQELRIEVLPVDEAPVTKAIDDDLTFELPGDCRCRVEWVGLGHRILIADACVVRAGAITELPARWPAFEVWTGEVQGYRELPQGRRWQLVAWDDGPWLGRGSTRVDPEGRFRRCLASGESIAATWRCAWSWLTVPARVVQIDSASRHLVLAADAVRWVAIEPEMEPPWFLGCVVDGGSPFLKLFARHDGSCPIPVAAGHTVRGALQGRLDRRQSTLAWWDLGDGVDRLVVRPVPGRWIELRPLAAIANRGAALVGPCGQWDLGYDLTAATPFRVWVPEGTRCVVVFDGDRPRQTAREFGLGSADFVVID